MSGEPVPLQNYRKRSSGLHWHWPVYVFLRRAQQKFTTCVKKCVYLGPAYADHAIRTQSLKCVPSFLQLPGAFFFLLLVTIILLLPKCAMKTIWPVITQNNMKYLIRQGWKYNFHDLTGSFSEFMQTSNICWSRETVIFIYVTCATVTQQGRHKCVWWRTFLKIVCGSMKLHVKWICWWKNIIFVQNLVLNASPGIMAGLCTRQDHMYCAATHFHRERNIHYLFITDRNAFCHHFWQTGWVLSCVVWVTQGWNRYQIRVSTKS